MFATRDTFFDDDGAEGVEPTGPAAENALIMPMPAPDAGMEDLLPGAGPGPGAWGGAEEESLMPMEMNPAGGMAPPEYAPRRPPALGAAAALGSRARPFERLSNLSPAGLTIPQLALSRAPGCPPAARPHMLTREAVRLLLSGVPAAAVPHRCAECRCRRGNPAAASAVRRPFTAPTPSRASRRASFPGQSVSAVTRAPLGSRCAGDDLVFAGGGMRPPMGAGGMTATDDDEFSMRPTSRGARMGGRGPMIPTGNTMGFDQPGGMSKDTPTQISATEQELARVGIETVFVSPQAIPTTTLSPRNDAERNARGCRTLREARARRQAWGPRWAV